MKAKTILPVLLLALLLPISWPMHTCARGGDMPPPLALGGRVLRFEHLTPEEGLPLLTVRDMVQDSQGFMWFATSNGLYRYDGYTFKAFRNNPHDPQSLSAESIYALYEDHQGVLWVGTWNGGLNGFDRATGQFTRYLLRPR